MSEEPLLTWKGRRVRSPGDRPETVARKVPEAPRPGSLFFIPSPLEGWGLDVLLERLPSDSAVVVLELDSELGEFCAPAWAQHLAKWTHDPRLFHLERDTEAAIQDLFRRLPLSRLRRCELLTLGGAWLPQAPRYREVFQRLDQGLTRWWSNRMTSLHMGPLWIRNLLDNAFSPHFAPQTWPDWGDDTVLVCGAGLTLEEALPWAREHRNDLRIVAADTALPVLRDTGLVPDAVVCLEAQHANLRDFAGWRDQDILLFTDLSSFPPGARVLSPTPRWFATEFADLQLWRRLPWSEDFVPRLPPLGSVGCAAAWVAWRLTRGSVVLAGLDFSFPAGRSHARGGPALAALLARHTRLVGLEQPGTWVRPGQRLTTSAWLTTPVMEGYAGVLTDQARAHAHRTSVWSQRGLPLGLEVGRPKPQRAKAVTAGNQTTHDPRWAALERGRLERILELYTEANAEPGDRVWTELEIALAEVDYLTFTFPDPEFRRQSDWLIRAQVQVRWALERLRRSAG